MGSMCGLYLYALLYALTFMRVLVCWKQREKKIEKKLP